MSSWANKGTSLIGKKGLSRWIDYSPGHSKMGVIWFCGQPAAGVTGSVVLQSSSGVGRVPRTGMCYKQLAPRPLTQKRIPELTQVSWQHSCLQATWRNKYARKTVEHNIPATWEVANNIEVCTVLVECWTTIQPFLFSFLQMVRTTKEEEALPYNSLCR